MSLHALAGHMATKGRGGDSMLVHMTPGEVQALQALAQRHGGTLTINPETGQPEANFLKSILPMVAGFALGPAGFGLMSAGMAGAAVGGITALSTGSLSRGLMAGLGAYGGASLGASLANAGTGAMAASDIAAQQAAGTFPTMAEGMTAEAYASQVGAARDAALAKAGEAGFGAKMSAGMGQMASNPGMYAKEMLTGLAAISPMMADEGVQTTTPKQDTGNIRRFSFDRFGQTYTPQGVFPAAGYTGMAQGGIVALAAGGTSYRDLTKDSTPEQIASAYKSFTSGAGGDTQANQAAALQYLGNLGIGQDRIGQAYEQFQAAPTYTQFSNEQIGGYLAANPNADIAAATQQFNADPRAVNQYISQLGQGFLDPTQTARGSGSGQYFDTFSQYGVDANELYAANKALNPEYSFAGDTTAEGLGRAFGTASAFKGFDPQGETQLLKDIEWVKQMDATGSNTFDIARLTGLSIGEVEAREAAAREAMKVKKPINAQTYAPEGTTNPYGNVTNPGDQTFNPDGSTTVQPNIPGRPYGGFTGMGQAKDVYTQGGGSLGYVNRAPTSMAEFNERFNRQTGDSLAAYNYLMGKGANPATQQRVGEIARPYSEAIVGIPAAEGRPNQKFIYQDGRYVENPNYVPVTYDTKGNRVVGMSSGEVLKGFQALPDKTDDSAIFDWVDENKVTIAQLAAAMGISVGEAQRRMNAVGKKKVGATTATSVSDSGYGVGDSGPGPSEGTTGGFSGMTSADMDAAGMSSYAQGGKARRMALGGLGSLAGGGQAGYNLGGYSDGGRLLKGPGDGVSDSIPATIGDKQPARLADGEFVVPARIVSELGNGSTEAGARKLYAMMDRVQKARGKTTGKNRVAANTRSDKYLPA